MENISLGPGPCYYCGDTALLNVTYFNFPISCNCCNYHHRERIQYCNNCEAKMPAQTKLWISTEKLLDPVGENLFTKIL